MTEKDKTLNRRAFQDFFEGHKSMVFNVCFRMIGDRQEAEDLTQEVFLRAFRSLKRFKAESKISTWLYRIAVNLSLNHQRKKKYARLFSWDFILEKEKMKAVEESFSASTDDPQADLEKKEAELHIQKAINSLPRRQRVGLLLYYYEGLSYAEIARVTRSSVSEHTIFILSAFCSDFFSFMRKCPSSPRPQLLRDDKRRDNSDQKRTPF